MVAESKGMGSKDAEANTEFRHSVFSRAVCCGAKKEHMKRRGAEKVDTEGVGLGGCRHVGDNVGEGPDMEGVDTVNEREGEFMVACRKPLQTGLQFKIKNKLESELFCITIVFF